MDPTVSSPLPVGEDGAARPWRATEETDKRCQRGRLPQDKIGTTLNA